MEWSVKVLLAGLLVQYWKCCIAMAIPVVVGVHCTACDF